MDVYSSILDLADKTGFDPAVLFDLWTWTFTIYRLVDITTTAVAVLVLANFWKWWKQRKKGD